MAVNFRSVLPALAWISTLGLAGLVSAQPPAPTADRPHLAKDAKEAMDFLGTWARVTSGEEYFKGATYVGSESCKGSGCHDQQLAEWRTTWHSKILTTPSVETVKGDFNNAVIPFQNIRAVAKGHAPAPFQSWRCAFLSYDFAQSVPLGFPGALSGKFATIVPAFRQGLSEAGYVERRNVTIEGRRPAA